MGGREKGSQPLAGRFTLHERDFASTTLIDLSWQHAGTDASAPEANMSEKPHYWTEDRVILREWLATQKPQLADIYAGVVELLFAVEVPGRLHFVCHGIREIGNRLPETVLGKRESSQVEYRKHAGDIAKHWRDAGVGDLIGGPLVGVPGSSRSEAGYVPVPRKLIDAIGKLIHEHSQVAITNKDRAQRFFEFYMSPRHLDLDVIAAKTNQWHETMAWCERYVHVRAGGPVNFAEEELSRYYDIFESALISLSAQFYPTLDKIDDILADTNRLPS